MELKLGGNRVGASYEGYFEGAINVKIGVIDIIFKPLPKEILVIINSSVGLKYALHRIPYEKNIPFGRQLETGEAQIQINNIEGSDSVSSSHFIINIKKAAKRDGYQFYIEDLESLLGTIAIWHETSSHKFDRRRIQFQPVTQSFSMLNALDQLNDLVPFWEHLSQHIRMKISESNDPLYFNKLVYLFRLGYHLDVDQVQLASIYASERSVQFDRDLLLNNLTREPPHLIHELLQLKSPTGEKISQLDPARRELEGFNPHLDEVDLSLYLAWKKVEGILPGPFILSSEEKATLDAANIALSYKTLQSESIISGGIPSADRSPLVHAVYQVLSLIPPSTLTFFSEVRQIVLNAPIPDSVLVDRVIWLSMALENGHIANFNAHLLYQLGYGFYSVLQRQHSALFAELHFLHDQISLIQGLSYFPGVPYKLGRFSRQDSQKSSMAEFMADWNALYVANGNALRSHINGLPDFIRPYWVEFYDLFRSKIYSGLEYSENKDFILIKRDSSRLNYNHAHNIQRAS